MPTPNHTRSTASQNLTFQHTSPRAQLMEHVSEAVKRQQAASKCDASSVDAVSLLEALTGAHGYRVRLIRAVGGGEGASCLHNLRHTFLLVTPPGRGLTRMGGWCKCDVRCALQMRAQL